MTTRAEFLERLAKRLEAGLPESPIRPIRQIPNDPIGYSVDLGDPPARFVESAAAVGVEVVSATETTLADVAWGVVEELGVGSTVAVTGEQVLAPIADRLAEIVVADHEPASLSDVSLGVTGAAAGVALTGSIVLDSSIDGARVVSLLPEVHLAVLRRSDIVATPGSIFRRLGTPGHTLPSNLVFITGPSRSADIELQLTIGVHGPRRVIVVLI